MFLFFLRNLLLPELFEFSCRRSTPKWLNLRSLLMHPLSTGSSVSTKKNCKLFIWLRQISLVVWKPMDRQIDGFRSNVFLFLTVIGSYSLNYRRERNCLFLYSSFNTVESWSISIEFVWTRVVSQCGFRLDQKCALAYIALTYTRHFDCHLLSQRSSNCVGIHLLAFY